MKILLIDDEKLLVKGLRKSLEQDGFQVTVAYDGRKPGIYLIRMTLNSFHWT